MYRIKVRRRHIWGDALNNFKLGIPVSKHLRVTFLGKPAVDAGGPRGFFQLLLGKICRNSSLFCGPDTARLPLHNVAALTKQIFKHIGCMIGASLLNGSPALSFLPILWLITFCLEMREQKLK